MAQGFKIQFEDIKPNMKGFISIANQVNQNLLLPRVQRVAPEGTRVTSRFRPSETQWAGVRITDPSKAGMRREAKRGHISRAVGRI